MRKFQTNLSKLSVVLCIGIALTLVASCGFAVSYSGSSATSDIPANGALTGTGQWAVGSQLSWIVSQNPDSTWHYLYNFSVDISDPITVILGVSPSFTAANLFNLEGDFLNFDVGTFSPSPSLPSLPGDIYGIRLFNASGEPNVTVEFDSDRSPVWNDFYSRGGKVEGINVAAFNDNFLDPNPIDPPSNGSIDNHILSPDTAPIPEPSAFALVPMGLMPLMGIKRRLRRA